jgi:hypothetical protein
LNPLQEWDLLLEWMLHQEWNHSKMATEAIFMPMLLIIQTPKVHSFILSLESFFLEQILITRSERFPLLLLQMHLPHSLLVRELMMITRKLLLEIWNSNKCNSSNDI